jgi:hypothetical protein
MIGVWLYALGIAVAGFLVWKFIPEKKTPIAANKFQRKAVLRSRLF